MHHDAPTPEELKTSVIERFSRVAIEPDRERTFPVGPASAKRLGYDSDVVETLPRSLSESFCGVGNPFELGDPRPGQVVLDLGCGAGFDSLIASRRVGTTGRVIGVDMTQAMIAKARGNALAVSARNVTFVRGAIEQLPIPDRSIDLVVSNGVFNLCLDKPAVLREARRVLKPGGRLQMADILLEPKLPPDEVARKGSWSD